MLGSTETDTPTLAQERDVVAGSDPVAVATTYLERNEATFAIADPATDLDPISSVTESGVTVQRFAQTYRGVPVYGAHYVVRMRQHATKAVVQGAGGDFFTALDVDVSTPMPYALATRAAEGHLGQTVQGLTASDQGSVVLPIGTGVLARHLTYTGINTDGLPVRQQVFVRADTGRVQLTFNELAAVRGPVEGTGPSVKGEPLTFNAFENEAGAFELRDRTKPMWPERKGQILTYDAKGGDALGYLMGWVKTDLVFSPTVQFSAATNKYGALDAHVAASQVYDYFAALGRDSIDGQGGLVRSVVGATLGSQPMANAFWQGDFMVYGTGGEGYLPFSAALDVVAHEMTHGVTQHTANLVYAGQSGAVNEAVSDYFGNAVENNVRNVAMTDPKAGLLGEHLCITKGPRAARCVTSRSEPPPTRTSSPRSRTAAGSTSTPRSSAAVGGRSVRPSGRRSPTDWSTPRSPATSPRSRSSSTPATPPWLLPANSA